MDLSSSLATFFTRLRREESFHLGPSETADALRALDRMGLADRTRVQTMLRAICCGQHEELERFDRAFDRFFADEQGTPQPKISEKRSLVQRDTSDAKTPAPKPANASDTNDDDDSLTGPPSQRRPLDDGVTDANAWQMLRAKYSPDGAAAEAPSLELEGLRERLALASRFIASVRLGRSRRWASQTRGSRFDLRRTLRSSLHTGGDPAQIRWFGHPLRNPRFVMLIDGSRSMTEHAPALLQFAYALAQRSRRTNVFVYSTALREITRDLRDAARREEPIVTNLGEAWGGGTRIGASLSRFVRSYGTLLTRDTVVIVSSDGLDVGDIAVLQRTMHELARRSAAIVWVNPHASAPGFAPTARGMQAAMPYISTLAGMDDLDRLDALWRRTEARIGA